MTWFAHEWRLLVRSHLSMAALLSLLGLTGLAVWSGLHEVQHQQQTITRLAPLHAQYAEAVASRYADSPDAGNHAYYTSYYTWDPPSEAAFLAVGLRDVVPYVLLVRALGLQAQLYEGEVFNPELALPGRFDFAFVLIYLAPLFVIAMLHDLISSERQSGRLRLLLSLPAGALLWRRRVAVRYLLLIGCLTLPVLMGTTISGTELSTVGIVLGIIVIYLAFWVGVSLMVATCGWSSVANATALMGGWALMTLVLPTMANVMLTRAVPVQQGVELILAQRQAVHGAWETPREVTMQQFFASHPNWRNTAPLPVGFHWKWYFAFHQVGDESVAKQVQAYRDGLLTRQVWTERIGWVLPSVGVQVALHRAANTDLLAHLSYQDQITVFHRKIRNFYYPYLFNDRMFDIEDFAKRPNFIPRVTHDVFLAGTVSGLISLAYLMYLMCSWRLSRLHVIG